MVYLLAQVSLPMETQEQLLMEPLLDLGSHPMVHQLQHQELLQMVYLLVQESHRMETQEQLLMEPLLDLVSLPMDLQ